MFTTIYRNGTVKVASTSRAAHRINVTNHDGGITLTSFAGAGSASSRGGKSKGKRNASLRLTHADAVALADALWGALAERGNKVSIDLPSSDPHLTADHAGPDVDKYNADGEVEAEKPSVIEVANATVAEGDGGLLTEVCGEPVDLRGWQPAEDDQPATPPRQQVEAKVAAVNAEIAELTSLFFS